MNDEWRDLVLKTLRETPSRTKDGAGFGMWVIQRVRNNASFSVTVRSGGYYTDKVTGERRYPKEGLSLYDFNALRSIFKTEIEPLLNIPKEAVVNLPGPRAVEEEQRKQQEPVEPPPW